MSGSEDVLVAAQCSVLGFLLDAPDDFRASLSEERRVECGGDALGGVLLVPDLQSQHARYCQKKVQRHLLMISNLILSRVKSTTSLITYHLI